MRPPAFLQISLLVLGLVLLPVPAPATDVDGPNDCLRELQDFGDAPEGVRAYPGVIGSFPTCMFAGPIGTQQIQCGGTIVPPPGPAGYVLHRQLPATRSYWLGCLPTAPLGIDSEYDGKVNDNGSSMSACSPEVSVDCFEAAFGIRFGQDECYGTDDAGLSTPVVFQTCQPASIQFRTYNCAPVPIEVYLNILVDWNQDGDWCDALLCPSGACAYEWAVQNVLIQIPPGCQGAASPLFTAGPNPGPGWMRITISSQPLHSDFPWNGTVSHGGAIEGGETEDYPVTIEPGLSCPEYLDFGDAPEEQRAYPSGVMGRFPTCIYRSPPGTQEIAPNCMPLSTAPGPTGHVAHRQFAGTQLGFWLGCWSPFAVDSEGDGKTNSTGAPMSACNQGPIDCVEAAFGGMSFGQDECTNDGVDAGIRSVVTFTACQQSQVTFEAYSCTPGQIPVYLNILVDWNHDGDWNDVLTCPGGACVPEWAVNNFRVTLSPGCQTLNSPGFLAGPSGGPAWMRVTLTFGLVMDDFPWNGSGSEATGEFEGGETEDYPVTIEQPDPCPEYRDFGDAPEGARAYLGVPGCFPTCLFAGPVGTQELACQPISTPPGPAGYVMHLRMLGDPRAFWLGCAMPPGPGAVDSEADGKMNDNGQPFSFCNEAVNVDCFEPAFALNFGQDECYGDAVDAGVSAPIVFRTCTQSTVTFLAMNCGQTRDAYLNVLVDWNQDGDWNDNFQCPQVGCAYEWAVKNVAIVLPGGCTSVTSPAFLAGPNAGRGWVRITLSEQPVPDDFPWNGSASVGNGAFEAGETEDYPAIIELSDPCPEYRDFGDAPEMKPAYPGVPGHFPTCQFLGVAGTQELAPGCPAISTPPALTGHVEHRRILGSADAFWLGCGMLPVPGGVDSETDGKTNEIGGAMSACADIPVDCFEPAFGFNFGQDECYADGVDAGINAPITFQTCSQATVSFNAMNCAQPRDVYLNILVDWNQDGDWNDTFLCPSGACAYEWAVKNVLVPLPPGCTPLVSPSFLVGPRPGNGWLRITLSEQPAPDDFPWNGTLGIPTQVFLAGETEDYPVVIEPKNPCEEPYEDFGDAPEEFQAYPGVRGHFPTCLFAGAPGTQEIQCGAPLSPPPGPTGYVRHIYMPAGALPGFWLGCPDPVSGFPGVDGEVDGKSNDNGLPTSMCAPHQFVDCVEPCWLPFGQDECTGDLDAGIKNHYAFPRCTMQQVQFVAYNCAPSPRQVFLNVLVDWNQDGDWNDNLLCKYTVFCAYEWAVQNVPVILTPGCNTYTSPPFRAGPNVGPGWLRITLSEQPVSVDFPWNGTASLPVGALVGGETEDYPIDILDSPIDAPKGPTGLWMAPPVPNPARGTTTIRFSIPAEAEVSLAAYDVEGRRVRNLRSGRLAPVEYAVTWDFRTDNGNQVPVGVYLVKLTVGDQVFAQRVIRTR